MNMKNVQYFLVLASAIMVLNACSADWLSQQPQGSSMTEEQFKQREDMIQGSVYGVYAMMYQYGGDHDVFGYKSIDMYGDFNCGDMAMKSFSYGWFQTDEMGQTYESRAYLWSFYYDIIRQCNKSICFVKEAIDLSKADDKKYIEDHAVFFNYYAQALSMRGWAYSNLVKWFCPTPSQLQAEGKTISSYKSLPIYVEKDVEHDTILGAPLSTCEDVYIRIETDLIDAIEFLKITEKAGITRTLKHEINSDVARLILAYSFLNKEDWANAYKWSVDFIENTSANILPNREVLTTGFSEVMHNNWIWGQDVNIQTSTSLASFFGQVDVFSYSYAWAGDVKGIDGNLYKTITDGHAWDLRSQWWNNLYSKHKQYQYAPDGKFFSPSIKNANQYSHLPEAEELDRNWLCDIVFMRAELGYLIAAEAACRLAADGKASLSDAIKYLTAITDERVNDNATAYSQWKSTLGDTKTVLEEIRYNWRVELWGEGFAMQTFRRFAVPVTLGENHKTRSKKTINVNDPENARKFTMEIPNDEQYYNPYLRDTQTLQEK